MTRRSWKYRATLAIWRFGIRWSSRGRPGDDADAVEWFANVGRGGFRMNERVRDTWRRRWLRLARLHDSAEE